MCQSWSSVKMNRMFGFCHAFVVATKADNATVRKVLYFMVKSAAKTEMLHRAQHQ